MNNKNIHWLNDARKIGFQNIKNKVRSLSLALDKSHTSYIKDLNIWPSMLKLLEEKAVIYPSVCFITIKVECGYKEASEHKRAPTHMNS